MLDASLTPTISRLLHPLTEAIPLYRQESTTALRECLTQLLTLLRDNDCPCPLLESSPGVARECWYHCRPAFNLNLATNNFKYFRLSLNYLPSSGGRADSYETLHLSFDLDPSTNQYLPSISS